MCIDNNFRWKIIFSYRWGLYQLTWDPGISNAFQKKKKNGGRESIIANIFWTPTIRRFNRTALCTKHLTHWIFFSREIWVLWDFSVGFSKSQSGHHHVNGERERIITKIFWSEHQRHVVSTGRPYVLNTSRFGYFFHERFVSCEIFLLGFLSRSCIRIRPKLQQCSSCLS